MSDPVSKSEIEDILSSIRRLVSEDARFESRRAPARARAAGSGNDRLVLTPALRVAASAPEDAAKADAVPPADAPPATERIADAAPGDTAAPDREDGAAPRDRPWADPEATLFEAARALQPDGATREEEAEEAAPAQQAGDTETPGPEPLQEMAPGSGEGVETGAEPPRGDTAEGTFEDAAEGAVSEDAVSGGAETAAARAEVLAAKIQALEAAIGRTRGMWEPDGAGGDDYAGTPVQTIAWEDHRDPEGAGPGGSGPDGSAARDAESETGILAADEAVLDEASLRELVSEIVREELQGALGERITRNVRKLVRREIHRALAMRNLE